MKKENYILLSSGRGPVECSLAVHGIQKKFREYLHTHSIGYTIEFSKKGSLKYSIDTIVFKINGDSIEKIRPWIGSILWINKSPVRRYHKRKNWFIKCAFIPINQDSAAFDERDCTIQTFRASGPGGQHRNKVESAVRVIHAPTQLMATASDSRSQHVNKRSAINKLRLKIASTTSDKIEKAINDIWEESIEINRGNPAKIFIGPSFVEKN